MATKVNTNDTSSLASTNLNDDEPISLLSDNVDRLKALLKKESSHHKETDQCYNTLRKEYDELLKKYAEAENTIDQYRIAAKRKSLDLGRINNNKKINKSKSVQQINSEIIDHPRVDRSFSLPAKSFQEMEYAELLTELKLVFDELQNDVQAFEGALVHNEFNHKEKMQIYDALKREFENIQDKFSTIRNQMNDSNSEDYVSISGQDNIGEEDLDGELYRLGLRLSEVFDEITEQRNRKDTLNSQKATNIPQRIGSPQDDVFLDNFKDTEETKSSMRFSNDNNRNRKCSCCHRNGCSKQTNFNNSFQSSKLSDNKHFGERYLSQSLPPDQRVERPPSSSEYAMGNTGTETSYFNQWVTNSKSEPAIHEAKTRTSKPNGSAEDVRTLHKDAIELQRPSNGIETQRPNTMNSTEDSGFIEIERIDSRINNFLNNLQVGRSTSNQSINQLSPNFLQDQQVFQSDASDRRSRHSSLSSGKSRPQSNNYYNGKIKSLQNFLQTEVNVSSHSDSSIIDQSPPRTINQSISSNESETHHSIRISPQKATTPRSYVRGKTLSTHSEPSPIYSRPSYETGYQHDEFMSENGDIIKSSSSHQVGHQTKQQNQHFSDNITRNRHSFEMPERQKYHHSNESLQEINRSNQSFPIEHLQGDMKEIKDLIIDMRDSLVVKNADERVLSDCDKRSRQHSKVKPITKTRRSGNSDKQTDKRQRRKKYRYSKYQSSSDGSDSDIFEPSNYEESEINHQVSNQASRIEVIQNNHLEVLRRLEAKLDFVTEEMKDYRVKNTKDINNNNITDSAVKINPLEKDNVSGNNVLQNIATRIDSLSLKLKESNVKENESKEEESIRAKLIQRIENKIEEIDKQMKYKENSKETSTHSPVSNSSPCPICGGMNTHQHGGYTHVGVDWNANYDVINSEQNFRNVVYETSNNVNGSVLHNGRKILGSPQEKSWKARNFSHSFNQDHSRYDVKDVRHTEHSTSPNIFHHYHSIHHSTPYPEKKSTSRRSLDEDMNKNHLAYKQPSYDLVERSLANASMAAFNMESISKKLLKTIASDLLNSSGPSEF